MADAIEIFTNSANERIEVITAGAQGPAGPQGEPGTPGATFDQDLNTTDNVVFAELSTGTIRSPGDDCQILLSDAGVDFQSPLFNFSHPASARTALGLGSAAEADAGDFATAAQGTLAATAVQPLTAPTLSGLDILDSSPSLRIAQSALGGDDVSLNDTSLKFGDGTYTHTLSRQATLSATATFTLPSSTGTLALTSDIPTTFAASAITSGTLGNARINWAAPSAIGGTTPAAGAFTSLTVTDGTYTGALNADGANGVLAMRGASQAFRIYNIYTSSTNYERGFFKWNSNVLQIGTEKGSGGGTARGLELMADGVAKIAISSSGSVQLRSTDPSNGHIINVDSNTWKYDANGVTLKFGRDYGRSQSFFSADEFVFGTYSNVSQSQTGQVVLTRDADNTLAQRNGTNAQEFRLYGTYTDASNYRRLSIASTTAGRFTLAAQGAGTGASGNELALTAPILAPSASVTLGTNGDLAFEATSNTTLTVKYRGSDGTTRSTTLTLS